MIHVKNLHVTKPFRYLWLKSVVDVDLSQHCARCLIGKYSKAINNKTIQLNDLNLENGVYYLCGVSIPYNWNNNFHLAFMYKEGETIHHSNNGIDIQIENAVALPISTEFIDNTDIHANNKSYATCRNWQFAHYFKKRLG